MRLKLKPEGAFEENNINYKQIKQTEYGCHDTLREGIRCIAEELELDHPLAHPDQHKLALENRLHAIRMGLGIGAAERLNRELKMTRSIQRIAGIPSSYASYEVFNGNDCEIDFADYLSKYKPISISPSN